MSDPKASPPSLNWRITTYEAESTEEGIYFTAFVSHDPTQARDHDGNEWHAWCGNARSKLDAWYATPDEAKAAVEQHIASGAA